MLPLLFAIIFFLLGLEFVLRLLEGGFIEQLPNYRMYGWLWDFLDQVAAFFYPLYSWVNHWLIASWLPPASTSWLPQMPADTLPRLFCNTLATVPGVGKWPIIQAFVQTDWRIVLTGVWDWGILISVGVVGVIQALVSALESRLPNLKKPAKSS